MSHYGKLLLTVQDAPDQEFLMGKTEITIGRSTTSDINLADSRVSRFHARVDCGPEGCNLVDLGSANGTFLNGKRIQKTSLLPGDRFQVGGSSFIFLPAATELDDEGLTQIASEQEMELALDRSALPMALNDTTHPSLVVYAPDRTWDLSLEVDAVEIGRSLDNSLVLDYPKISRHHALLKRNMDSFVLRDLGSTNGTWFGKQRIEEYRLQNGDSFQVGPVQLVYKAAFTQEELTYVDTGLHSQSLHKNPVVFVPGLMGSELWQGSEKVWPNMKYLIRQPELFIYREDSNLEARGILNEVVIVPNLIKQEQYSRMGDYLVEELGYVRNETLLEFAYDWRQDVRLSARKLAEAVASWKAPRPITLIAHSLGTLVSRYYVERLGGKDVVDRLILMGGPHSGVPKIASNLISGLKLLPFGLMGDRLGQVIASFPSCYQILPTYACAVDENGQNVQLLEEEGWVQESYRPLLRSAREFRRELGNRTSVPTISIFGYGLKTITELRIRRGEQGRWTGVSFDLTPKGDSSVPERSAVLEGTEIHPVQQFHGTLFVDADVRMRLKMELLGDSA
jgi:pSer/pThr/pTyr-binding forkhead associated (FHA) protein